MITPAEVNVNSLAGQQSGYVTRRQALACGMTAAAIRHRTESGRWKVVRPGLYLLPGFALSLRGRLAAACVFLGAVVSHESAAELHGLPGLRVGLAVVTTSIRGTHRFPDVVVHQSTDLTADHVVSIDLLPVTSPIRTVIDLAANLKPAAIGRMIDRLVIERRATLDAICVEVERLARRGKPGIRTMRRALEPRVGITLLADSELEQLALRFLSDWGFPDPVLQFPLPWRSARPGRVDFAYPQWRLIIEIDGRAWHATLEAFENDRLRDNHALLAGWRVLRITYRMLKENPGMVRDMIQRAIDGSDNWSHR
ncbi:MAG TPA: type IV toxin-antitoxin system AbiEi family antitoxin domain-containing protein [Acidimicrobiia bacterium]|nr:type IV toxin-antitoxin system AbiEi family antitoxin domain-containing protein [Acidimicrobiia bacterium]